MQNRAGRSTQPSTNPTEDTAWADDAARIVIVDDHPVVRQGLAQSLGAYPDLDVVGEAPNTNEALTCCAQGNVDVMILDLSLGRESGLEFLSQLHARYPDVKVLVLSFLDEDIYAERALRHGAMGFVSKGSPMSEIIHAARVVAEGHIYAGSKTATRMLSRLVGSPTQSADFASPEMLSARELEVFRLIGKGMTTREIGETLHLGRKTVEHYRSHVKTKLGVSSFVELVRLAVYWELSDFDLRC